MSESESRREILAKMIREAEEAGLYEAEAELYGIRTIEVGEVNWNATALQYMKLNKQRADAIQRVREAINQVIHYNGNQAGYVNKEESLRCLYAVEMAQYILKELDGEIGSVEPVKLEALDGEQ